MMNVAVSLVEVGVWVVWVVKFGCIEVVECAWW